MMLVVQTEEEEEVRTVWPVIVLREWCAASLSNEVCVLGVSSLCNDDDNDNDDDDDHDDGDDDDVGVADDDNDDAVDNDHTDDVDDPDYNYVVSVVVVTLVL